MALNQMCFKLDVEWEVAVLKTSLEILIVVLKCIHGSTVTKNQNLEANILPLVWAWFGNWYIIIAKDCVLLFKGLTARTLQHRITWKGYFQHPNKCNTIYVSKCEHKQKQYHMVSLLMYTQMKGDDREREKEMLIWNASNSKEFLLIKSERTKTSGRYKKERDLWRILRVCA